MKCARRGESGTSLAAKRFEQQRQQELLQQVPLRQFDDCSCYAAKMMTIPATAIPTYDCPCGVPDSATADNAARIPPPPPPLLFPVGGEGGTATCEVCGRALSASYGGCRCAAGVWESLYSRLPAVSETGSHVTYVSTTATGPRRLVASSRPSDVTGAATPLDDVRHVTMTSALGDGNCTLTSTRRDNTTATATAGRRATSDSTAA